MNKPNRLHAIAAALAASAVVCAGAACGGSAGTGANRATDGKGGATGLSAAGLPTVVQRRPSAAVEVLRDSAPEAVTAGLARTLLATAPVVVVARPTVSPPAISAQVAEPPAEHPDAITPAAESRSAKTPAKAAKAPAKAPAESSATQAGVAAARAAHAPLLLASSVTAGLASSIKALHPRAVLVLGLPAGTLAARLPGVQVTGSASRLPATAAPADPARLVVLDDTAHGTGSATSTTAVDSKDNADAIAATAAAAGATVVGVDGDDPRADPGAIKTLARLHPQNVVAVGKQFGSTAELKDRLAVAETGRQLPGGGQVMFPGHRLVALYGHPGTPGLGALGQQDLSASVTRARELADQYRSLSGGVPVVPAFELIATVAEGSPGPDGSYSYETPVSQLEPWVKRAAADGVYVVLDLQPGRASLLDQAKHYQSLLKLPNVGLALDPEWKLQPGQVPLQQIGHVDISEVNSVIGWLAALTARYQLPQKVLVLHQFRTSMIVGESQLDTSHDDLAIVLHMDGQGTPSDKVQTWDAVTADAPRGVFFGWKDFFVKDTPMLGPRATIDRHPVPVMISYQLSVTDHRDCQTDDVTAADRERLRETFESAARLYHTARPEYPEELYDELLALTGLTVGDPILEAGAGTGKATLPLARRGHRITCVELGAALAQEARRNLAAFPRVDVVTADFETWARQRRADPFAMVFAATAWHWIAPEQRYRLAAGVLRPGGHLAFWSAGHVVPEGGDPFFREIQDVYDEIGESGPDDARFYTPQTLPDSRAEIAASGLFADVAVRRFDWEIVYTADQYLSLLNTFSGHIAMEPWKRDRLFGEIRRRLADRPDGLLRRHWGAVLNVARRP